MTIGDGRAGAGAAARPPDQGFRQRLALSSACEMYRRISGSFTRETGSRHEAAREASVGVSVDTKGQDLVAPVAALLTGGLAGVAASSAGTGADPLTAAFTGLLAALGAAAVFKVSGSRSRKRSYVEESKFVRDLTVATLDREIPVLVERCLDAGLVPLFIVDELDKVQGLSDRITSLVRRLKKLVAERAFFCFLADRQYFEEMRGRTRRQPYPIEYTYFTHDLFVVFDHRDLHRYLLRAVAPLGLARVPESLREISDRAPTPPFDLPIPSEVSSVSHEETEDLRILRYVLLHRAKMHTIDLRRLLTRLQGEHGILEVPPGAWRTRAHLCDLVIQVAVEMVLEGEAMTERLGREPGFRRLAHDALYYPSRRWEDKQYDLDLSDEKEAGLDGGWWTGWGASRRTNGRAGRRQAPAGPPSPSSDWQTKTGVSFSNGYASWPTFCPTRTTSSTPSSSGRKGRGPRRSRRSCASPGPPWNPTPRPCSPSSPWKRATTATVGDWTTPVWIYRDRRCRRRRARRMSPWAWERRAAPSSR